MKYASIAARYLLGLVFTLFGLNGFLHFIPVPPPPTPFAVQYMTAVSGSHYMAFIFLVQLIGGVLLLVGRFVPIALILLAAVIANVLDYHLTMDPKGVGLGLFTAILWVFVFLRHQSAFRPLFRAREGDTVATL